MLEYYLVGGEWRQALAQNSRRAGRGADVARAVARQLVVYHRRAGGQSQFSTLLERSHSLPRRRILSPRKFSRAFRAETRQSPAKAVENLRVEAARLMMAEPPSDRRHRSANGFCRSRPHAPRLPARLRTAAAGDPAKRVCGGSGVNAVVRLPGPHRHHDGLRSRACSCEQRYGHLYLVGSGGYAPE